MKNYLKTVGCPSIGELQGSPAFPKKEDYLKGPIAVIECIEEIPCNPCETSCPKGAIRVEKPITNLPVIDFEKCSGCGICAVACPGLAIYVKDYCYSENESLITFPYEYLPLPESGDTVTAADRKGQVVCRGRIVKVLQTKMSNKTALISMVYDKKYFEDVVTMKRL
ncbi:MAG TPA: 4Fe-4S binding protein [Clostridia bacterium]|nr:4Fe-4S binding protein [Clostridia bacterium]